MIAVYPLRTLSDAPAKVPSTAAGVVVYHIEHDLLSLRSILLILHLGALILLILGMHSLPGSLAMNYRDADQIGEDHPRSCTVADTSSGRSLPLLLASRVVQLQTGFSSTRA
jgi:hypothetical protein